MVADDLSLLSSAPIQGQPSLGKAPSFVLNITGRYYQNRIYDWQIRIDLIRMDDPECISHFSFRCRVHALSSKIPDAFQTTPAGGLFATVNCDCTA